MKKLLIVLTLVFLSGCSATVDPHQMRQAHKMCASVGSELYSLERQVFWLTWDVECTNHSSFHFELNRSFVEWRPDE